MLILKITINKVIYRWVRSLFRSQNFDVYFDINMITNINMTIVNTSVQIHLREYQYKENHPYTDMTNEYGPKDKTIYMFTSFDYLCKR